MPRGIEEDYVRTQLRALLYRVQRIDCADDFDRISPRQDALQAFLHDPNITHDQNAHHVACFVCHLQSAFVEEEKSMTAERARCSVSAVNFL
jgi:hypothetical protein